jgi:glucose/mannose-6-phosphate isomerase
MNLDDFDRFSRLDSQNMYQEIHSLPDQLSFAWDLGQSLPLTQLESIHNIVITGMGGSAIGGDLLLEFIQEQCPIPVLLHRDYDLPGWVSGENTLVITCSHSGNTEETLSSFRRAQQNGCQIVVISTGGELVKLGQESGYPSWVFHHEGQPRSAIGYSFGLLLALFYRLNLIKNPTNQLEDAVATMNTFQQAYLADIPVIHNPAKRLAGQLIDRDITIMGAGFLNVIARRWKCQFNEIAKSWAGFEYLPEADHNTMAGITNPEDILYRRTVIFLRSSLLHPRNQLRSRLTQQKFMVEGLNTDSIDAKGNSILAHLWSTLHLGDYAAFYLAMLYDMDPTPIPTILELKMALSNG